MAEVESLPPSLARVLVTGGQGFIGAYILRDLLRQNAEVVLLDLKDAPHILEQVLLPEELMQIRRIFTDISNADAVRDAVLVMRPTAIIHLAGMQIPLVRERPAVGAAVNVTGTINVFEAVRALAAEDKADPIPVIYASSAGVLGPSSDYPTGAPLPAESHYHKPRTLYGVLKLCNEGTARIYWQDYGVPSVGMRPLTVFGVGREVGLTSGPTKAVKAAILGRRFECQVTGVTGWQYVADVARFFIGVIPAVAEKSRGAHVCGLRGHVRSMEDFLKEAAKVVPQVAQLASISEKAAAVPIHGDVEEAPLRALLGRGEGEELHTPLAAAIAEMATDFAVLQRKGALKDTDLGPPPAAAPAAKL